MHKVGALSNDAGLIGGLLKQHAGFSILPAKLHDVLPNRRQGSRQRRRFFGQIARFAVPERVYAHNVRHS
jgi:hypothetical protein